MTPSHRKPTFVWQAVLILLPVAVLAAVGIWALQQDRASVERQTRSRAESLASATLADLEKFLRPVSVVEERGVLTVRIPGNVVAFSINSNSSLVWPYPIDWPPRPEPLPADLSAMLRSNKLGQWQGAETAFSKGSWAQASQFYLEFLNGRRRLGTNVMADIESGMVHGALRFRGLALFRRGIAFEHLGQTDQAIQAYDDTLADLANGNGVRSEAGLSLPHLAALKILGLAQDESFQLPEDWKTNPTRMVVQLSYDASPFEQELLQRLRALEPALAAASGEKVTSWFDSWERNVEGRRLYAEAADLQAGDTSPWPAAFWVQGRFPWLALAEGPFRSRTNSHTVERYFVVFPETRLAAALVESVQHEEPSSDFAVRMELSGRAETARSRMVTDWHSQATSFTAQSANYPLAVTATLADPPAFFAVQRRRQSLYSALLLTAALTCVAAFLSARRAFVRQVRLNEMRSNFVSSVSHELRAPIASVRLMAESLERGKIPEASKQQEYFHFISQECRRLSSLIENVLDFSRIDQGRKQYEFEPTDLVALAQQTIKLMEPCAAEKGVQLALSLDNDQLSTIHYQPSVDGKALQQALINLIDNAIKHSPKGEAVTVGLEVRSPKSEVRSQENEAHGPQSAVHSPDTQYATRNTQHDSSPSTADPRHPTLCLWVEDRGPGIPREEHEKIFERFYRLGSELRRETQGVGIGLSIVKHVVEAHGGRVVVRSDVGQGSRFTIELPISNNEETKEQS